MFHDPQNVHAPFFGLHQCGVHDFLGDALNLYIHLQRGDTAFGASNFEIHVTQMILVAKDIGQHCKTVTFFDQSHGNACHVRLQRHARIH